METVPQHPPQRIDYRDVAIEQLAADEAALRARVASLEADVESYRLVAQQAIHAVHRLTVAYRKLVALCEQYRRFRAPSMAVDDHEAA